MTGIAGLDVRLKMASGHALTCENASGIPSRYAAWALWYHSVPLKDSWGTGSTHRFHTVHVCPRSCSKSCFEDR